MRRADGGSRIDALAARIGGTDPRQVDPWPDLFRLVWPFACAVARSEVRTSALPVSIEDLAQEGLVRAWRGRHRFRPGERFLPWLATIIRNHARDEIRKEASRTSLHQRFAEESPPLAQTPPETTGEDPDALLARALASLTERDQEVLRLWTQGRLDECRDVRTGRKVAPSTARGWVRAARARLLAALDPAHASASLTGENRES